MPALRPPPLGLGGCRRSTAARRPRPAAHAARVRRPRRPPRGPHATVSRAPSTTSCSPILAAPSPAPLAPGVGARACSTQQTTDPGLEYADGHHRPPRRRTAPAGRVVPATTAASIPAPRTSGSSDAQVGDGLPARAGRVPARRLAAAARARGHRRGSWSRTGSPARTSTRTGSFTPPRTGSTCCAPPRTTGPSTSGRAACTRGWTSTSTPSG